MNSKKSRLPTLEPLKVLADRCVSKQAVHLMKCDEFDIIHLSELIGEEDSQRLQDEDLLELAAKKNLVLFTADKSMRKNELEKAAIIQGKVKVFSLPKNNYLAPEQAEYFLSNKYRILQKSSKQGPFFYTVRKNSLDRKL